MEVQRQEVIAGNENERVKVGDGEGGDIGGALEDSDRNDGIFGKLRFPDHEECQDDDSKDQEADNKRRAPGRKST